MRASGIVVLSIAGCAANRHAQILPKPGAQSIFLVRTTTKDPDLVVSAIKSYAAEKKWQFLGTFKVRQGEVSLVKFCIPEVGKRLWLQGLELSAMLPCGNVGVYKKNGRTEISLLHPRYMSALVPDPAVEEAGRMAEPLLVEMLDAVAK